MLKREEIAFIPGSRQRLRLMTFFVAAMLWLNFLFVHDFWEGTKKGLADFSVFYTAGTILREGLGRRLYETKVEYEIQEAFTGHISSRRGPLPFIHPPFEGLIFLPLSWLTYRTAFLVWDAMSVLMLFATAVTLRSCIDEFRKFALWKSIVCALAFFPVIMCLLQGQDSILLLLCCALALRAMKENSDVLAGCWFALGSFKFQFTVPIVLLFFLWKRRRVVLGFLPIALVLVLVSVGISGLRSLIEYPRFALQVVETHSLGGVPLSLLPNLHGLVAGWGGMNSGWLRMGALAASVLLFGFAVAKGGSTEVAPGNDFEVQFSLAVVVAVLVAWQTNIHDLSLLTLPLVLLTSYALRSRDSKRSTFRLLYPALILLVSPLWMVLWLWAGLVNLMAIPMIWWAWILARELPESAGNARA